MNIDDKVEVLSGTYKGRKGIVAGESTHLPGYIRVKLYQKGTLPCFRIYAKQEPYFSKNQLKQISK